MARSIVRLRQRESSVVLIDGEMLAILMINHNIGTTVESLYEVKYLGESDRGCGINRSIGRL